ncbi:MAG TPA: sulfur oxidation c-type cytochrome SoxX [Paracoccus sp. (in: a-proteobacteria)]|nr:sulfur oxidation c-type cytochrome SoxX [Paracoccus sp. (in: a-proteobacteria)]
MLRLAHLRPARAAALAALAATPVLAAEPPAPSAVQFNEGSVAQPLTGQPGSVESGKKIMSTNSLGNCVACHQVSAMPDVDFQGNVGPSLDGVAGRYDEAHLRGLVVNAKHTFEVTVMPAFYKNEGYIRPGEGYTGKAPDGPLSPILDAQQIEDVVAYLLTLK